jgi:hypothetical protein
MNQQYTPLEIKAARILCRQHAEGCGVDADDLWKFHSEDFKEEAKALLDQCGVTEMLSALEGLLMFPLGTFQVTAAKAAVAKATGDQT